MLTRWNPFSDLISMREAIDRLFDESFVRPGSLLGSAAGTGSVPFDLYESGDQIVVRSAIPGADPSQIELTVNQGMLTIKGSCGYPTADQGKGYTWHVRGLPQGTFQFAVSLPTAVDADAAEASYDAGILTVTLPKAEAAKAKPITIKGAQQQALPAGAR